LRAVFAEIAQTTNAKGKPQSASAMAHPRTTLRAALNLAVHEGVIAAYPARLPFRRRPDPVGWRDRRGRPER
jgi:hypothetical protein